MSYKNVIKSAHEELVNTNTVMPSIDKKFIQNAIIDSAIRGDIKSFNYILKEYVNIIDIFEPIYYQEFKVKKTNVDDSGSFYEEKIVKKSSVKTSILEAAFLNKDSSFALLLVNAFNLSDIKTIDKMGNLLSTKKSFLHILNMFNNNDDVQKNFFNMGVMESLLFKEKDNRNWIYNSEHLEKLKLIVDCLKDDELKESLSNYYVNNDFNIKELLSIVNMTKAITDKLFLDIQLNFKKILNSLNDEAKLKALVQLSQFDCYDKSQLNKKLSYDDELSLITTSSIKLINKDFYKILTNVKKFNEKVLGNSTLKSVVVFNELRIREMDRKLAKESLDKINARLLGNNTSIKIKP